jgi:DNA-directed RNA polymerase subunit E'
MFQLVNIEDFVGIPPYMLDSDLNESIKNILNEEKIGLVDKDFGVVLGVVDILKTDHTKVLPGDSNAYVNVEYSLLTFKPDLQNVYEGYVKEVAEFGVFMDLGPFDALIHVSQLMNDFVSFDPKNKNFVGKESNHVLGKGDLIYARVVSVSYKNNAVQTKIGLTMRQSGLGKMEWIEKENTTITETKVPKEKKEKATKANKEK